eukprot:TRINITY_DN15000_c0_g2_i1.p1 TRINITY_DN15000_c0_g2~~TRINITY_DN15000_c0_g2_i1.p1  ORF type:complete len:565 (-),score=163.82 TRINITY_DN15000_c0_g2_i1:141-1835(-)
MARAGHVLLLLPFLLLRAVAATEEGEQAEAATTAAGHAAHASGHGHDVVEVSDVVTAIAVCLFGFLVMNFMFLYLVNYRDENVRRYIYNMMSTTISIFCAVLLNEAVFSFFLKQILVAPWPRGLNLPLRYREKFVVGVTIFSMTFFLINYLCYRFSLHYKDRKEFLYAVATIGGHLCAFAGIYTFGELQQKGIVADNVLKCFGVSVLAFIFLTLFRVIAYGMRARLLERPEERYAMAHYHSEEEEEESWVEHAVEAEDEATILIHSYLVHQCIGYVILGELPNFEREAHVFDQRHVLKLFYASLAFLGLLLAATTINVHEHAKHWKKRMVLGCQNFITMSMCWCIQTGSEWLFILLVSDKHLAAVITAFVLTMLAMVLIVVLDFIADRLHESEELAHHTPAASASSRRSASGALSARALTTRALSKLLRTPGRKGSAAETPLKSKNRLLTGINLQSLQTWASWERALRNIINGFGLLVGLSWDKAFDVGELGIVYGFEDTLAKRPVISRFVLCFALVAIVLPAWIWYIVPLAQKTEADFQNLIEREIQNELGLVDEEEETSGVE